MDDEDDEDEDEDEGKDEDEEKEKAEEDYEGGRGPRYWFNMAIECEDAGQAEEAMEAYERALELRMNFPEAYFNMGRCSSSRSGTGSSPGTRDSAVFYCERNADREWARTGGGEEEVVVVVAGAESTTAEDDRKGAGAIEGKNGARTDVEGSSLGDKEEEELPSPSQAYRPLRGVVGSLLLTKAPSLTTTTTTTTTAVAAGLRRARTRTRTQRSRL